MAYNLGTTLYWITLYSNRSTTNETYLHCQFTTVFNVQLMKCFNVFIHKCNWNKYKVLLSLFNKAWNKTKRKLLQSLCKYKNSPIMCHIRQRLGHPFSNLSNQNVAYNCSIMKCTPLNDQYYTMSSCSNTLATIFKGNSDAK